MSNLLFLRASNITPKFNTNNFSAVLGQSLSPLHFKYRLLSFSRHATHSNSHALSQIHNLCSLRKNFSVRAFDESPAETKIVTEQQQAVVNEDDESGGKPKDEEYPSGQFEFKKFSAWKSFSVKLRMLVTFPWERVRKGSVFTMKLRGQISDQLKSRFSSGLSLPQICENFIKAAYDPRISDIYLHIEPLNCGWGKVEEIRRHIIDFKKSGKFIFRYVPICGEKEYYVACADEELYAPPSAYFSLYGLTVQASFLGGVLEKVGVEPQVQRQKCWGSTYTQNYVRRKLLDAYSIA